MIDFANINTTRDDCRAIARIASRANHMGIDRPRLDLIMDLEAAHHVCPLDLDRLVDAPAGDFGHDISGIIVHLDRETGDLVGGFRPRYARA